MFSAVAPAMQFPLESKIEAWLPGQMSESVVLWDMVDIVVKRTARGHMRLSALSHLDRHPLLVVRLEAARPT